MTLMRALRLHGMLLSLGNYQYLRGSELKLKSFCLKILNTKM